MLKQIALFFDLGYGFVGFQPCHRNFYKNEVGFKSVSRRRCSELRLLKFSNSKIEIIKLQKLRNFENVSTLYLKNLQNYPKASAMF